MNKFLLFALSVTFVFTGFFNTTNIAEAQGVLGCVPVTQELRFGQSIDQLTGQVLNLQDFLYSVGLLTEENMNTERGVFGINTLVSLFNFQDSRGLNSEFIFVGPQTRAMISQEIERRCGGMMIGEEDIVISTVFGIQNTAYTQVLPGSSAWVFGTFIEGYPVEYNVTFAQEGWEAQLVADLSFGGVLSISIPQNLSPGIYDVYAWYQHRSKGVIKSNTLKVEVVGSNDFQVLTPRAGDRYILSYGSVYISWSPNPDSTTVKAYLQQRIGNNFQEIGEAMPAAKGSIRWGGDIGVQGNRPSLSGQFRFRLVDTATGREAFSGEFTLLSPDYAGYLIGAIDGNNMDSSGGNIVSLKSENSTLSYQIGPNLVNCKLILNGNNSEKEIVDFVGLGGVGRSGSIAANIDPTGVAPYYPNQNVSSYVLSLRCDINNVTPIEGLGPVGYLHTPVKAIHLLVNFDTPSTGEKITIDRVSGPDARVSVLVSGESFAVRGDFRQLYTSRVLNAVLLVNGQNYSTSIPVTLDSQIRVSGVMPNSPHLRGSVDLSIVVFENSREVFRSNSISAHIFENLFDSRDVLDVTINNLVANKWIIGDTKTVNWIAMPASSNWNVRIYLCNTIQNTNQCDHLQTRASSWGRSSVTLPSSVLDSRGRESYWIRVAVEGLKEVFHDSNSFAVSKEALGVLPPPTLNSPTVQLPGYVSGKHTGSVSGSSLSRGTVYFDGRPISQSNYTVATDDRISFMMPTFNPGTYPVYVVTPAGRSNTINIVIPSNDTNPSISNVRIQGLSQGEAWTHDFYRTVTWNSSNLGDRDRVQLFLCVRGSGQCWPDSVRIDGQVVTGLVENRGQAEFRVWASGKPDRNDYFIRVRNERTNIYSDSPTFRLGYPSISNVRIQGLSQGQNWPHNERRVIEFRAEHLGDRNGVRAHLCNPVQCWPIDAIVNNQSVSGHVPSTDRLEIRMWAVNKPARDDYYIIIRNERITIYGESQRFSLNMGTQSHLSQESQLASVLTALEAVLSEVSRLLSR